MGTVTPLRDLGALPEGALSDEALRLALRRAFGILASKGAERLSEVEYRAAVRGAAVQVVKALERAEQQQTR